MTLNSERSEVDSQNPTMLRLVPRHEMLMGTDQCSDSEESGDCNRWKDLDSVWEHFPDRHGLNILFICHPLNRYSVVQSKDPWVLD